MEWLKNLVASFSSSNSSDPEAKPVEIRKPIPDIPDVDEPRQPPDHRDEIVQMLKDTKVITAEWDAGGDSTLCSIKVDGVYADFDRVRYAIIDVLSLPNASENYDKGKGVISLNEQGEIVLTYSCRQHTYGDSFSETIPVAMEDPAGLRSFLHKAEVTINAHGSYSEADNEIEARVNITTIHGDAVEVKKDKLVYYEDMARNLAMDKIKEPHDHPGQELSSIYLSGMLTQDAVVYFQTERSYDQVEYHNNKTVVLPL